MLDRSAASSYRSDVQVEAPALVRGRLTPSYEPGGVSGDTSGVDPG